MLARTLYIARHCTKAALAPGFYPTSFLALSLMPKSHVCNFSSSKSLLNLTAIPLTSTHNKSQLEQSTGPITDTNILDENQVPFDSPIDVAWNIFTKFEKDTPSALSLGDFTTVMTALNKCNTNESFQRMHRVLELFEKIYPGNQEQERAWNMILHSHVQRKTGKADEYFQRMLEVGIIPNGYIINTMIYHYVSQSKIHSLEKFCKRIQKIDGVKLTVDNYKNLIRAFAKVRNLNKVRNCYRELVASKLQPDIKIFENMITIHANEGDLENARLYYDKMRKMKIKPSQQIFFELIQNYTKYRYDEEANVIYEQMCADGLPPSPSIFMALRRDPLESLAELRALGISVDARGFNTFIADCIRRNDFEQALQIFTQMREAGIPPDQYTYSSIINTHVKNYHPDQAISLFESMKEDGFEPDVVTYTCVLNAHTLNNDIKKVTDTLTEMISHGVKPNIHTFNSLLGAVAARDYLSLREFDFAYALYRKMPNLRVRPDTRTFNTLLSILESRALQLEYHIRMNGQNEEIDTQAFNVIKKIGRIHSVLLHSPSAQPDFFTYIILIQSYCALRALPLAMRAFNEMCIRRVTPTVEIFNSLIHANDAVGNITQILALWQDMKVMRIEPNNETYALIMSTCQRNGYYDSLKQIQAELDAAVAEGRLVLEEIKTDYKT